MDSNNLHRHLPPKIKKKEKRRTLIRRLAAKGYKPERKISKNDPGPALMKKRLKFAKKYSSWDASDWKSNLQAVGDFKDFTWYPYGASGLDIYSNGVMVSPKLLAERGCRVTVLPAETTVEEILAAKPDGLFVSNGPGDPAAVEAAEARARLAVGQVAVVEQDRSATKQELAALRLELDSTVEAAQAKERMLRKEVEVATALAQEMGERCRAERAALERMAEECRRFLRAR